MLLLKLSCKNMVRTYPNARVSCHILTEELDVNYGEFISSLINSWSVHSDVVKYYGMMSRLFKYCKFLFLLHHLHKDQHEKVRTVHPAQLSLLISECEWYVFTDPRFLC